MCYLLVYALDLLTEVDQTGNTMNHEVWLKFCLKRNVNPATTWLFWSHPGPSRSVWSEWNEDTLLAHTFKVKLIYRRKQSRVKVMSNWGSDKVTSQRKMNASQTGCIQLSREQLRKGNLLKNRAEKEWESLVPLKVRTVQCSSAKAVEARE